MLVPGRRPPCSYRPRKPPPLANPGTGGSSTCGATPRERLTLLRKWDYLRLRYLSEILELAVCDEADEYWQWIEYKNEYLHRIPSGLDTYVSG